MDNSLHGTYGVVRYIDTVPTIPNTQTHRTPAEWHHTIDQIYITILSLLLSNVPEVDLTIHEVQAQEVVDTTWKYPQLKRICACESGSGPDSEPRQFNKDGTVLLGVVNKADTGMCQLNTKYHLATAQKLGFNIFTAEGNKGYAEWLYEKEGSKPWNWSKACWSK